MEGAFVASKLKGGKLTMRRVFLAVSLVLGLVPCAVLQPAWAATGSGGEAGGANGRIEQKAGTGFLDIASDPPAKITIDDADTGKVTPQPHLELPEGHHRLTLVTGDGAHKKTIGFSIKAGETTKLTLHLAS
jgi:hypothetical protein